MKTKQDKQAKAIKTHNKHFQKATRAGKRVMVAKDALERVLNKQLSVECGLWCDVIDNRNRKEEEIEKKDETVEFQEIILSNQLGKKITCQVCAVGALFVSAVSFKNRCKIEWDCGYYFSTDEAFHSEQLTSLFSEKQRLLIENAFECGGGFTTANESKLLSDKDDNKTALFGESYKNDGKRLIAILKNIIQNRGTFKP